MEGIFEALKSLCIYYHYGKLIWEAINIFFLEINTHSDLQ